MLEIGAAAPDVTIRDEQARPIELGSLWAARPVVLLFLRHLG